MENIPLLIGSRIRLYRQAKKISLSELSERIHYRELLDFAQERLDEDGRFAIVLPAEQELPLTRYARMCGLHLFRMTRIRTVPRKNPNRIVAEFSRSRCEAPEDRTLTIQDEGKYTQEYL
ncbi:MAG: hypothetical protein IJO16_07390, partial [Clostridia bacterium]|nr:hypothetical protein [Clostridia bacterium]